MNSLARITAIGSYVPDRILTNHDLEKMVDTNDDWITRRTGIKERRIADEHTFTSDLCVEAVNHMINAFHTSIEDVDMIIVCTHTPDFPFPSTACIVQERLGIKQAGALDVNATCAGFTYGLHLANGLISAGLHEKVLVIGADTLSKITDYTDRTTCILFGDGAGAVLIEKDPYQSSFIAAHLRSDGSGGPAAYRTGLCKQWQGQPLMDTDYFVQNGKEVYRWAVKQVALGVETLCYKADMVLEQINWFIPHNANLRMMESISERIGFSPEQILHGIKYFGNTSAASIPLSLDLAFQEGRIQPGDRGILYGFGAGFVHAGLIVQFDLSENTL